MVQSLELSSPFTHSGCYRKEPRKVVTYLPAQKLLKLRSLEELENYSRLLKNSSGLLEELFKNCQGGEIDDYPMKELMTGSPVINFRIYMYLV